MNGIAANQSERRHFLERIRSRSLRRIVRGVATHAFMAMARFASVAVFRAQCWLHEIECGCRPDIFGRVVIRSGDGKIIVGDRVQFISSSWRSSASAVAHPVRLRTFMPTARIIFGDGSGMSGGSVTARSRTIRIGKNTLIGPDCMFVDSDFHIAWPPEERNRFATTDLDADVSVGDNVWFGARCVVLKGVTIGDNSVIAAGSVVMKSVPANALAGGNPARVLKIYTENGDDHAS